MEKQFEYAEVEAALCLWEAVDAKPNGVTPWAEYRAAHGTTAFRWKVINSFAGLCTADWQAWGGPDGEVEKGFPTFDWDFCPAWLEKCVVWTLPDPEPAAPLTRRRIMMGVYNLETHLNKVMNETTNKVLKPSDNLTKAEGRIDAAILRRADPAVVAPPLEIDLSDVPNCVKCGVKVITPGLSQQAGEVRCVQCKKPWDGRSSTLANEQHLGVGFNFKLAPDPAVVASPRPAKLVPVCEACGSTDISGESAVRWNTAEQAWVSDDIMDKSVQCHRCMRADQAASWYPEQPYSVLVTDTYTVTAVKTVKVLAPTPTAATEQVQDMEIDGAVTDFDPGEGWSFDWSPHVGRYITTAKP